MIDLKKVHERESFVLKGQREMTWSVAEPIFSACGFVLIDDFTSIKRSDKIEQWQTETLADCTFFAGGKQVYPDECNFDSLVFAVLISSLPKEQILNAIRVLFNLADRLGMEVMFAGQLITQVDAPTLVERWLADVLDECGDVCGSESVRLLTEMEYDKRRV